jgi:mRNA interferase YafQ
MRQPVRSKKFEADLAQALTLGLEAGDWEHFVFILLTEEILPPEYDEHLLHGRWKGYLECHLAEDLLVIYRRTATQIIFAAMGTHRELFKNQPSSYAKMPKQRPKRFKHWPFRP